MSTRLLQHAHEVQDILPARAKRILQASLHGHLCRQVEDGLCLVKSPFQQHAILQVSRNDLQMRMLPWQIFFSPAGEIIQHTYAMTFLQKQVDGMRADETSAPDHQNTFMLVFHMDPH
jgi:hypothetical protein